MKNNLSNLNFIKVLKGIYVSVLSGMVVIAGMSNTYAQSEDIPEEPASWYQIELIIFEYTNTRNAETEIWQRQPGSPEQDLSLELMDSKTMLEKSIIPDPYLLLNPEEFLLKQEYKLIKSSPQRNPLLHVAWRQPANSMDESIPVRIHGGKLYSIQKEPEEALVPDVPVSFGNLLGDMIGNKKAEHEVDKPEDRNAKGAENILEQIDGTIKISRERYLHVWTDLVYRLPSADIANISYDTDAQHIYSENTASVNTSSINMDSSNTNAAESPVDTYNQAITDFRLQEHRRMRSKELHYVDHPLFGVIVMATPYELPEIPVELPPAEAPVVPENIEGKKLTTPAIKNR